MGELRVYSVLRSFEKGLSLPVNGQRAGDRIHKHRTIHNRSFKFHSQPEVHVKTSTTNDVPRHPVPSIAATPVLAVNLKMKEADDQDRNRCHILAP
jgi:hypothetical protein